VGNGPQFAGTPAYMSPEQARGEDTVSMLGVIFSAWASCSTSCWSDTSHFEQIRSPNFWNRLRTSSRDHPDSTMINPERTRSHLSQGIVKTSIGPLFDSDGHGQELRHFPAEHAVNLQHDFVDKAVELPQSHFPASSLQAHQQPQRRQLLTTSSSRSCRKP